MPTDPGQFSSLHEPDELEAILANDDEPLALRYAAAQRLGRMGGRTALQALIRNTGVNDDVVLAGIATALGQSGDVEALPALERIQRTAGGSASGRATFMAALITYRLGLPGHDLTIPDPSDLVSVPSGAARRMDTFAPSSDEAAIALRSLAGNPFRIELVEIGMRQVHCGEEEVMLILTGDAVREDLVHYLTTRKGLPAILARRQPRTDRYVVSRLILTSPRGDGKMIGITGCRTNGDLMMAGTGAVERTVVQFDLQAVARPGAVPFRVTLSVAANGSVQFDTANRATRALTKREPGRLMPHPSLP